MMAASKPTSQVFCTPTAIRTQNINLEDSCDILFTIGAICDPGGIRTPNLKGRNQLF